MLLKSVKGRLSIPAQITSTNYITYRHARMLNLWPCVLISGSVSKEIVEVKPAILILNKSLKTDLKQADG